MSDWVTGLLGFLLPPRRGADPYKWRMAVLVTLATLVLVVGASLLVMHGGLAWAGSDNRVAWTAEVDSKIVTAIAPIQAQLQRTEHTGNAILRALYLPQVRDKVRQRCDEDSASDRARINVELDRIRAEYATLAGTSLGVEPRCDEV